MWGESTLPNRLRQELGPQCPVAFLSVRLVAPPTEGRYVRRPIAPAHERSRRLVDHNAVVGPGIRMAPTETGELQLDLPRKATNGDAERFLHKSMRNRPRQDGRCGRLGVTAAPLPMRLDLNIAEG